MQWHRTLADVNYTEVTRSGRDLKKQPPMSSLSIVYWAKLGWDWNGQVKLTEVAKMERITAGRDAHVPPRETWPLSSAKEPSTLRISTVASCGSDRLDISIFLRQAFLPLGALPTSGHRHESRPIPCPPVTAWSRSRPRKRRVAGSVFDHSTPIDTLKPPRTYINLSLPSRASFF